MGCKVPRLGCVCVLWLGAVEEHTTQQRPQLNKQNRLWESIRTELKSNVLPTPPLGLLQPLKPLKPLNH